MIPEFKIHPVARTCNTGLVEVNTAEGGKPNQKQNNQNKTIELAVANAELPLRLVIFSGCTPRRALVLSVHTPTSSFENTRRGFAAGNQLGKVPTCQTRA